MIKDCKALLTHACLMPAWASDSALGCLLQPGAHQECSQATWTHYSFAQHDKAWLRLSKYLHPFVQHLSGRGEVKWRRKILRGWFPLTPMSSSLILPWHFGRINWPLHKKPKLEKKVHACTSLYVQFTRKMRKLKLQGLSLVWALLRLHT